MINNSIKLSSSPIKKDWKGSWVWCASPDRSQNTYAMFRRSFSCEKGSELTIDITADTFYLLYIDGLFIHRGPARAHTEFYSYDQFSLTLAKGNHCIAVLVHSIGKQCATHRFSKAGLLVDAFVEGQDLSTNEGWKAIYCKAYQDMPEMLSHFGWQENVNYTDYPNGWQNADFDDSDWQNAVLLLKKDTAIWKHLCKRDIPTFIYSEIRPQITGGTFTENRQDEFHITVSMRKRTPSGELKLPIHTTGNQYIIADFGCSLSGTVEIEIAECQKNQEILISYDDQLDENGFVNPSRTYARYTDRFVLDGKKQLVTTALARGFRYAMIDIAEGNCKITNITALKEEYPYPETSAFSCSDASLNALYEQCIRTTRICTLDGFTDCVTRERVLWMQDLYIDSLNIAYATADFDIVKRMLFLFAQGQQPDGRIITYTPSDLTWCSNPPGNFQWIQLLAEYYCFTKDTKTVKNLLPTAKRLLDYFASHENEQGLINSWAGDDQFWDWGYYERFGTLLMTNAYYALILDGLAKHEIFNEIAGKAALEKADSIKKLCFNLFWDEEKKLFFDAILPDGNKSPMVSQQANMLAILSGVCPQKYIKQLMNKITDLDNLGAVSAGEMQLTDESRDNCEINSKIVPPSTLVGAATSCLAAFLQKDGQFGLNLIKQFWLPYADQLTLPELIRNGSNNTVCHGWSASPAYLLPMYVLGLRPTDSGWSKAAFSPLPMDLENASGSVWTPQGRLSVSWQKMRGGMRLSAKIPKGIKLTVSFGLFSTEVEGAVFEHFIID